MVAGRDEHRLGNQSPELLGDEVAGIRLNAIVLVEIASDGQGVHVQLERQIDDARQSPPQLFATLVCFAGGHRERRVGAVEMQVGEVQYSGHTYLERMFALS